MKISLTDRQVSKLTTALLRAVALVAKSDEEQSAVLAEFARSICPRCASVRAYGKMRRADCKARGLCETCQSRKAIKGKTRCRSCMQAKKLYASLAKDR